MPMVFTTHCCKNPTASAPVPLLAALALCTALLTAGCAPVADAGGAGVAVDEAQLNVDASFRARLRHQFSEPILDALRHGVSLNFEWRLELRRQRPGLWDPLEWEASEILELSYRPLSQRYTLRNPSTGVANSFPDLPEVLRALNRIERQLEPAPPAPHEQHYYRLRARLVISRLPPALRLPSYLSSDWRMDSGWHEWPRA